MASLEDVIGFIVVRMKPMCKILNLGHVFALLPDSHHFAFRRSLFTRFQELSMIVLIKSIILASMGELQLWVPAKLPSGKKEDKMKRLMKSMSCEVCIVPLSRVRLFLLAIL
jgi:hypothetical protein